MSAPGATEVPASTAAEPRRVDGKGLGAFLGLTVVLSWAWLVPLWLREGLKTRFAVIFVVGMMLMPALSAFIVTRWVRPPPGGVVAFTGLHPRPRQWRYYLAAWLGIAAITIAAPFVGALLGKYPLDLHLSGMRALLEANPKGAQVLEKMPLALLVVVQMGSGLLVAPLFNSPATFGEEFGWRGYLLPSLLPLGQWKALLIHGVIWGLWHAPVIAMGHNYPSHPRLGILLMVLFCTLIGLLMGWLRLGSGSVWPCVIAHSTLNGFGGAVVVFSRAGVPLDSTVVGITGWTGWILPALWVLWLVARRRLPVPEAAAPPAA